MKSPFDSKRSPRPFLAPLAARRWQPREFLERIPPFVAPVAVTVIGGIALVVALVAFLSSTADAPRPEDMAAASAPAEPSAQPAPTDDEPASETATAGTDPAPMPDASAADAEDTARLPESDATGTAPPVDARDTAQASPTGVGTPVFPDPGRTSSIPPARPGGDALPPQVEIAETEEEIATLEALQRQEVEADVGAPSNEWTGSPAAAAPPESRTVATTTKWVNMRSGPSDDAEVLTVVPALEEIEAETGCDWCAVTYDGQDGFIYKTFLTYAEGDPTPNEAATTE